jgi:hypothetical protein
VISVTAYFRRASHTYIIPLTTGLSMVAKCSNPPCRALFRNLKEGRLFLLQADPMAGSSNLKSTEYFWLCASCAPTMTLHLNDDGGVVPVVFAGVVKQTEHWIPANRHGRVLLSDVSFSLEDGIAPDLLIDNLGVHSFAFGAKGRTGEC